MASSLFRGEEELAKKDDDHKPATPSMRPLWSAATGGPRRKLKRLAIVLGLAAFVYFFISNLPTNVPVRDRRRPVYRPEADPEKPPAPGPMPKMKPDQTPLRPLPPQKPSPDTVPPPVAYNGPLLFQNLLPSLQGIYSTGGTSAVNKNVLFAAASLRSTAMLLPLACQMGNELRNYVHFALLGGSDIEMEKLRAINGIDASCQVIFHDARPDFASTSTVERLRRSSVRALYHINNYMHPQAMIIDASGLEEDYFLTSMRKQAPDSGIPLIELPENSIAQLGWISKLDSSSLAAWDKISIDILVHAPPGTSGGLINLLKSLSAADFSAGSTPHLTIELPHGIDRATTEYLKMFQWPPKRPNLPSYLRQLTLRHRIPHSRLTEEESSVRFLESFWPSNPRYSHVLVLSPQTQLSRQFFHYVKYTVLHYLYSEPAAAQQWDSRLLGFSLDLPSTRLDDTNAFKPPSGSAGVDADGPQSFLWQAPNSNAALFTGQKWTELHALVSNLLDFQHKTQSLPSFFTDKLVSKKYPSWLEHALKLARARGYWTLYPNAVTARHLATVHSELYRAPEEYEQEFAKETPGNTEFPIDGATLLENLPGGGKLLAFDEMPLLAWDGQATALPDLDEAALGYVNEFRQAVGGCQALTPEDLVPKTSMKDLFCMKDE